VTAVGVTLCETPDVPTRGEVQFFFPSSQRRRVTARWRVALGDIHPSGDIPSLCASGSQSGRIMRAANGLTRGSTKTRARTDTRSSADMADCRTVSWTQQGGSEDEYCTAVSDRRSPHGDRASWKDPL
jgi:hypothetical protein